MFKRAHHYLTFLLVVILILAAPMKISEASVPAQGPPGYPAPPPEISSYSVWRIDTDPSRPYYYMEIYGPNGMRMYLNAFTEIINGEEIIQNIQIASFEIGWPTSLFFGIFPVECEYNASTSCRQCVIDEITLCYEAYLGTITGVTATAIAALAGCLLIKWTPLVVTCILTAVVVGVAAICVSVVQYQSCYRDIPNKCNSRFPGCVNAVLWGIGLQTCRTWVQQF